MDPIDSLIYTAQVYELHKIIEDYRIPESERIACSYRIKPDVNGSFFDKEDTGWGNYIARTEEMSDVYKDGYVLVCDITDFYNQINVHRIKNIVSEAGEGIYDDQAGVLEAFLLSLNIKTSRGIPVGPAASIVLAEAIMADIDKKILNYTRNFVRWVDDIRIFFKGREEAAIVLHELTRYLYSSHRLVFSGEKTTILRTQSFMRRYFQNEEKEEEMAVLSKTEELTTAKIEEMISELSPYSSEEEITENYEEIFKEVFEEEKFKILSNAYYELLEKRLKTYKIDVALFRHIFRKSSRYRIRSLIPLILNNFEMLLPVIREVVIYLNKVLNEATVKHYKKEFEAILDSYYMQMPFVNRWIFFLLQHRCFNAVNLPEKYEKVLQTRDQALLAIRRKDKTWVKDHKDGVDVSGPWDKRAVLFASQILSEDEMSHWLKHVSSQGDIIDEAISSFLISIKKSPPLRTS